MIDAFDLLLGSARFRRQARPDLIIQLGPPPISSAWDIYQADNPDCVRCVIAAHGWNDPHSSADLMVFADPADTAARVAAELGELPPRQGREAAALRAWAAHFAAGNQLGWHAVTEVLSQARGSGAMREGEAMRAAVSALPGGTLLSLGNSLPIRTIDTYCSSHSARVDVMSQRGANGIDGLISGAAGAARALRPARPVVLILGDVSFVHDVGGLYAAAACDSPLAIIVIDNRGGRIFDQLPISRARYGTSPELYAAHWLTPPGCDIAAAAAMFGLAHARARTPEELTAAVTTASAHRGATIIHAEVEPDSAAADRRRISELVDAGVASLPALAEIPANDSFEEVS